MLDDTIKSIHAQLYERAVSPFTGSFIISWLIWNHEAILIIFSDEKVTSKLSLIDKTFSNIKTYDFWFLGSTDLSTLIAHGFMFPIFTALFYIFLYPIIAIQTFAFSRLVNKMLINIKKYFDDKTLYTLKDMRKISGDIDRIQIEFDERLKNKDKEITRLTSYIKELDKNSLYPPRGLDLRKDDTSITS